MRHPSPPHRQHREAGSEEQGGGGLGDKGDAGDGERRVPLDKLRSSPDRGMPIDQRTSLQGKPDWRDGRREMERNKIVVRFSDGRMLKGHANDFLPSKAEFHVETLEDEISLINVADLKAVFFVKGYDGDADRQDGRFGRIPLRQARRPTGRELGQPVWV